MARYAYFPGCVIPSHLPQMELADRRALPLLGIELVELEGATCCPDPIGVQGLDKTTWLAIAARNLCLAEEMGANIITPCTGCFETLKEADTYLKKDLALRGKINGVLAKIGKKYMGRTQVKHVVEVLHDDVGAEQIAKLVVKPLTGLRAAPHHGCHLVRPSKALRFDDPEYPTSLDDLIGAIGAEPCDYPRRMLCCGTGVKGVDRETAMKMAREKLVNVKRAEADCMVVACPSCMNQYDLNQGLIERTFGEKYDLPVLYYSELLALALGVPASELGLHLHRAKVDRLLEKTNGNGRVHSQQ
jgi:heterodisulfide reductase subunit B2